MQEIRKSSSGKPEGKIVFRRYRSRLEYYLKCMLKKRI
jgi:hypothetical protein